MVKFSRYATIQKETYKGALVVLVFTTIFCLLDLIFDCFMSSNTLLNFCLSCLLGLLHGKILRVSGCPDLNLHFLFSL